MLTLMVSTVLHWQRTVAVDSEDRCGCGCLAAGAFAPRPCAFARLDRAADRRLDRWLWRHRDATAVPVTVLVTVSISVLVAVASVAVTIILHRVRCGGRCGCGIDRERTSVHSFGDSPSSSYTSSGCVGLLVKTQPDTIGCPACLVGVQKLWACTPVTVRQSTSPTVPGYVPGGTAETAAAGRGPSAGRRNTSMATESSMAQSTPAATAAVGT